MYICSIILFPLKKGGKRVVMEFDATAVQAVSLNDLLSIVVNMYVYEIIRKGLETAYSLYKAMS